LKQLKKGLLSGIFYGELKLKSLFKGTASRLIYESKELALLLICSEDFFILFSFLFSSILHYKLQIILSSGCLPNDERVQGYLDMDGLPPIGAKLETGNPYYW